MIETINWQEDLIREVKLTGPMMDLRLIRAKETYLMASRGSFKTTMGIAFYLLDCTYELQGCSGLIVGPSFEHLLDNTLNPLFNSLTRNGLVEGVHFVVGTPPPKSWPSPYIRVPAKKFDHIISWHNGSNQYLVSMSKKGSANGISAQYGIFDEAKFLKQEELKEIVFPAFRGNEVVTDSEGNEIVYKDHSLYLSKFFASDKWADFGMIKWLLDKAEKNDYRKFDIIKTLQLKLNDLILEYNDAGINKRDRLKPQIHAIETRLNLLRQNLTCYMESSARDSVQILGEQWLKDKQENSTDYDYKIVYMNENPDRPADQFYPDFSLEKHTYASDTDYMPNRPLIIAADYQHSVSPICICQIGTIPGRERQSFNYIDHIYTLAPDGLEEAIQMFCDNYKAHRDKKVYYIYDQTAIGKRVNADTYYKIIIDCLRSNRWNVIPVGTGRQPGHYQKWVDTKKWLINKDGKSEIMINAERCPKLIKSIMGAPATGKGGMTKKDKKFEDTNTYPQLDQSETTHFSDVFDMINHAVFKLRKIPMNMASSSGGGAGGFGFR